MALDSYSNLKAAIAAHTKKGDTATYVDDWIDLAEAEMNRRLRIKGMEASTTLATVNGTDTVSISGLTRFRGFRWLYILEDSTKQPLDYLENEYIFVRFGGSGEKSLPRFYDKEGTNLRLGPTPDDAYTIYVGYWSGFEALSNSVTTNGLLDLAPDLYFYATMKQASITYEDEAETARYEYLMERAIQAVQDEDDKIRTSGNQLKLMSDVDSVPGLSPDIQRGF